MCVKGLLLVTISTGDLLCWSLDNLGTTPHKGVAPELAVSVLNSTLIGYQPNGVERSKIQLELSMQYPNYLPFFMTAKPKSSPCV